MLFRAGGALRSASPHGAASVRRRLSEGDGLSPIGLVADPALVASTHTDRERFGRDASLRCPHYEPVDGRCGVWAWREATCATWFCKHTRGAVSKAFWNRLHQLLRAAERHLARHCAVELGIPPEGIAMMHPMISVDGTLRGHDVVPVGSLTERGAYERLWGPWTGREEAFYRAAYRVVEPMSWDDVVVAAGSEVKALSTVVRLALSRTRDESIAGRVALGSLQVVGMSAGSVRVQGYSFLDPLDVPRVLFDVLHHFDGRPLAEAISQATEAAGEPVPEGAIRMLIDFGVLRAV